MIPPNPQTTINNTTEIYSLIRAYGHAKFSMKWTYEHGFKEPEELQAIIDNKTPNQVEYNIIYAKKCKLYKQIYNLIEDCQEQFNTDISELKKLHNFAPKINYQITPKTEHELALKACRYIHPTSLEFTNCKNLTWRPTRKIAISQIEEPIPIIDQKFVQPSIHKELKEFHDKETNNENRFEIRIHKFYEYFLSIFPEKYHHFIEVLESTQNWEI